MHSPGPWRVEACPEHGGKHPLHDTRYVRASNGNYVCAMRDTSTQSADARLIAAAPELLVAAVALLDLHGWEPGSEWGEEEREIFQRCMNLVGETTDAMCGGKIGERKVIADQANEALRGARGAAPVLSGVSTREDLIYWLGCVDRNGVWTDEDSLAEYCAVMTLDEAWDQVALMCSEGGE